MPQPAATQPEELRPDEIQTPPAPVAGRFSHTWRALRHPNFRLFFAGQTISLIGTWMVRIATSWLVYRLTGSALLLGVVGFVGQIPSFLLAPFAGVWVDRMDRRKLLVWTQVLLAAQSLTIAALIFLHRITMTQIIALSILQGVVNAFDMPARQSFVVQMVEDKRDLGNAIAINSSMVNLARLVGPALAGFIIAGLGEAPCFLIDGVSYLAVIASLLMMQLKPLGFARAKTSMLHQLAEGWTYVRAFTPIRDILLLFGVVSLMAMPFLVLMPIFATEILHGDSHTLGYLMGASGLGALIAALSLAARKSVVGLTQVVPYAALLFGAALIAFGFSRSLPLSLLLMALTGFGMMQGMASSNTIIQTLVPEQKRGRVMSYYTVAFVGMAPFGSLLAGELARRFGAPHAVLITGACVVLGSLWFLTRLRSIREIILPIYTEMGILGPATLSASR